MYARILVAIDDLSQSQAALDLVKEVATEGSTEVRALHLRLRELSGYRWAPRETRNEASFIAESATFELRMAGLAAGGSVRYATVDRVAEAILAEAEEFGASLIVLGSPRRGELLTRLFGGVTLRVVERARCPVLIAPRRPRAGEALAPDASASGRR
jgi:nucleotide-binding universal stress UspA family protein